MYTLNADVLDEDKNQQSVFFFPLERNVRLLFTLLSQKLI